MIAINKKNTDIHIYFLFISSNQSNLIVFISASLPSESVSMNYNIDFPLSINISLFTFAEDNINFANNWENTENLRVRVIVTYSLLDETFEKKYKV